MEEKILQRLEMLEKKNDAVYETVKKTQRYFMWTLIITVALFVLPLIALIFIIPTFIGSINSIYGI